MRGMRGMRGIILGTRLKGRAGRPRRRRRRRKPRQKKKTTRRRTGYCGLVRRREDRGARESVANRTPNQCGCCTCVCMVFVTTNGITFERFTNVDYKNRRSTLSCHLNSPTKPLCFSHSTPGTPSGSVEEPAEHREAWGGKRGLGGGRGGERTHSEAQATVQLVRWVEPRDRGRRGGGRREEGRACSRQWPRIQHVWRRLRCGRRRRN